MVWFDPNFWSSHCRRVFVRQVRAFEKAVLDRVLPAFDGIEAEAEAFANEEFERLGRLPGDESVDMGDLADAAQEAGIGRYEELDGVRQALLNLCAAALYHMVEQQLFVFHRRQVLDLSEEGNVALLKWPVVHERFAALGVTLKDLHAWPAFYELECVANTVKHGDGRSADALRTIRPEILVPEILRGDPHMGKPVGHVQTPLTGDGIYVTTDDLRRYADAAVAFWEDVADAIERVG